MPLANRKWEGSDLATLHRLLLEVFFCLWQALLDLPTVLTAAACVVTTSLLTTTLAHSYQQGLGFAPALQYL